MATTAARIRRANESDCEAIADLIANLRLEEHGLAVDRVPILSTLMSAVSQPACGVFVAESGDAIAGFILVHWVPFPMLGGTEGYISDLIVAAEVRGAGIGRTLLHAVEDEARNRGCVRLMLNNRIAAKSFQRGFYPKSGYRHREDFANFVKVLR
jgi:ribosomal protein S18 acetylase RimI-like enzyme